MKRHLLKTLVAVLAIAAAATGPARAQGTVQLTLASNNSAMGYATVALHPEYELYDTYYPTTSSSQDGTKTSMWTYASVTDGAWINTSTESNSSFSVNPNYGITIHHVTFYNANNQSVEVEPNEGNSVYVQLKNGNVYKDYDGTQLLLSGGITRVEAYGMQMSLPAGVTATETAGVYDVVPGTQVPVAAVAKRHYQLNNWSNNATTDTVTVTVNAAMTLTANFVASPVLTLVANNAQMGRVEIPLHQGNGFLCEFKAVDYAGQQSLSGMHEKFYFNTVPVAANSTVWTNNEDYSNDMSVNPEGFKNERYQCRVVFVGPNGETYEFDFSNNNNHFADVYLKNGNTYSDYSCNNLLWEGGVASIECYGPGLILPDGVDQITDNTYSVLAGTEVPVEATAKLRYHFVNWSNNSTAAQTTFTMPATAATLTANFVANPTLTLTATPAHGGSVGFDFTPTPQTLTVNDGTVTNGAVPINPCYLDNNNTRGQHIIPAEQLGLMAGGTLNSITWYVNDESSWSSTSNVNVYLKEVDNTTLTEFVNSDTTLVYTGTLSYADGQMTVTFSRPYTYQGGNLLVGVDNPTAGNYTCHDFFGVEAPAGSSADAHGYYTVQSFLPKSTFNYTPALPAGVFANTDGTYSVAAGTQFTLKANAADDYTLGSWSNQAEVNANATQTLTMPATDLTIGATFVGQPYTVRMAAGTEDAANWSLSSGGESVPGTQVLENVMSGSQVTATYNGTTKKVKSVKAVKYVPPVLVQSIVLNKQTAFLAKDSTMTLSVASVLPENAADKSYSWSSDDIAVADVDQNGVVIGHNAGTANIIATANDGSGAADTCVVTVLSPAILDGVTVLYVSNDDNWSTIMGYNPGLMYQDGGKVRLTSNGAFLYYDGHPLFVDDLFYPGINGYQWLRVVEISGNDFYYHQGETWQEAIDADRQYNEMWSKNDGKVIFHGDWILVDTNREPVDPTATIDPSVDYDLDLNMDNW